MSRPWRTDTLATWRVGLVYKPKPNGTFYAAYGTSFNPSAEGLTLGNTATAANSINTPPEQTRSFELGTKLDLFYNKLSLGLALFRTEKTNTRTEDPPTRRTSSCSKASSGWTASS